jgi:hypothetical protein
MYREVSVIEIRAQPQIIPTEPDQVVPTLWLNGGPITLANDRQYAAQRPSVHIY